MRTTIENAVSVDTLVKRYDDIVALAGVTFQIKSGEIFGILGPNGAGKTTLIEIVEGLRVSDEGTVRVLGRDPEREGSELRKRVSIAMQKTSLPALLTVKEVVRLYASIYGYPETAAGAISRAGLDEKGNARLQSLSGGQSQRLTVALAMMGEPELVLLDEPTSELDPQGRRYVWGTIKEKSQVSGTTVVLTTHQMDEAQRLCDRVAIIDHGRLMAVGTPTELIARYAPEKIVTLVQGAQSSVPSGKGLNVVSTQVNGVRESIIKTNNVSETLRLLSELETNNRISFESMNITDSTLEDVFLQLTGHEVRA